MALAPEMARRRDARVEGCFEGSSTEHLGSVKDIILGKSLSTNRWAKLWDIVGGLGVRKSGKKSYRAARQGSTVHGVRNKEMAETVHTPVHSHSSMAASVLAQTPERLSCA